MNNDQFVVSPRKAAVGKSSVISVRLPDKMIEQLEDIAKKTGRTRNELVQMCIDYSMDHLVIADDN